MVFPFGFVGMRSLLASRYRRVSRPLGARSLGKLRRPELPRSVPLGRGRGRGSFVGINSKVLNESVRLLSD